MGNRKFSGLFLAWALAAVTLVTAAPALAVTVDYSTTDAFTCSSCTGSGTTAVTYGTGSNTLTLTFNGIPAGIVATPMNASAGDVIASTTGTGAMITGGSSFLLTISQTVPSVGYGNLTAALSGTITTPPPDSSSAVLNFSTITLTLAVSFIRSSSRWPGIFWCRRTLWVE